MIKFNHWDIYFKSDYDFFIYMGFKSVALLWVKQRVLLV